MTFQDNKAIKAGLVAKLKNNANIIAVVPAAQIHEAQWQGREFSYPAIRVRIMDNIADNSDCNKSTGIFSIMVFSEDASSLEADEIAGIIKNELHKKSFTSSGVAYTGTRVTNLVPAVRQDTNTWRSEVMLKAIVS